MAGVVAAAAAIVFGVIPLVQARRKARLPVAEARRAEVSGGQGAQVGAGNEQVNQYIQTYTENQHLPAAPAHGSMVVTKVPQRAPAFPRRNDPDRAARLIADAERIAQTITDESWKHEPLVHVAGALAATDPDRAEHIAQSIPDDGWKVSALTSTATTLAVTDPDRAAHLIADAERIAQSIPDEQLSKDLALADIAGALAATDPDRAEGIAQSIWDDDGKDRALASIAATLAAMLKRALPKSK